MTTCYDQTAVAAEGEPFPLPGMTLDGRIVVASVPLNDNYRGDFPDAAFDELALVLLLNPTSPYFSLTQVTKDGNADWTLGGDERRHHNIVTAVDDYQDSGGDL